MNPRRGALRPHRRCLSLCVAAACIAAATPAGAPPAAGAEPPPESPLAAGRDVFRPDELLFKLDPTARRPILGDGSALDTVLRRYGATQLRHAFAGFEDASGRLTRTARESAARARARYPKRTARAPVDPALPDLENVYRVSLAGPTDVLQALAELAAQPGVVYVEPNYLFRTMQTPLPAEPFLPDDRYVSDDGVHWSEGAWGQAFLDLYGLERVRAIEGWNQFDLDASGDFDATERRPGEGVVVAVVDRKSVV